MFVTSIIAIPIVEFTHFMTPLFPLIEMFLLLCTIKLLLRKYNPSWKISWVLETKYHLAYPIQCDNLQVLLPFLGG